MLLRKSQKKTLLRFLFAAKFSDAYTMAFVDSQE